MVAHLNGSVSSSSFSSCPLRTPPNTQTPYGAPLGVKRRLMFTTRLFQGESFYLDLRNAATIRQRAQLEADLGLLGARVEAFLSTEVTHVITDRHDNVSSPSASLSSPAVSRGGSNTNTPMSRASPAFFSRARALLDRSVSKQQDQNPAVSDPLAVAKQRGIRVTHVQKLLNIIEKEKEKCDPSRKLNGLEKSSKGVRRVRGFDGPFVKVEDVSRLFKPSSKSFKSFPAINLYDTAIHHTQSPFVARPKETQEEKRVPNDGTQVANPVVRGLADQGCPKTPAAETTPKQAKCAAKTVKVFSGFCEPCDTYYKNLKEHVKSDRHKDFSANKDNFTSLDEVICQLPTMESLMNSLATMNMSRDYTDTSKPCNCSSHPCVCKCAAAGTIQCYNQEKPCSIPGDKSQNLCADNVHKSVEQTATDAPSEGVKKLSEIENSLQTTENVKPKSSLEIAAESHQVVVDACLPSDVEMEDVGKPIVSMVTVDQGNPTNRPDPVGTTPAVSQKFPIKYADDNLNGVDNAGSDVLNRTNVGDHVGNTVICERFSDITSPTHPESGTGTILSDLTFKSSVSHHIGEVPVNHDLATSMKESKLHLCSSKGADLTAECVSSVNDNPQNDSTAVKVISRFDSCIHKETTVLSEDSLRTVINELDLLNETCLSTSGSGQVNDITSGKITRASLDVGMKHTQNNLFDNVSSSEDRPVLDVAPTFTSKDCVGNGAVNHVSDFNFDISPVQLLSQFAFTCLDPPAALSQSPAGIPSSNPATLVLEQQIGNLAQTQSEPKHPESSASSEKTASPGLSSQMADCKGPCDLSEVDDSLDKTIIADDDSGTNDCKQSEGIMRLLTSFDETTRDVDTRQDYSDFSVRSERTYDYQVRPFKQEQMSSVSQQHVTDFKHLDFKVVGNREPSSRSGNVPSSDPIENSIAMNLMKKLQQNFDISESEGEDASDVFLRYNGPCLDARKSSESCILNDLGSVANDAFVCDNGTSSKTTSSLQLREPANNPMSVMSSSIFHERGHLDSWGSAGTVPSPRMPLLTREQEISPGTQAPFDPHQPPSVHRPMQLCGLDMPELKSEASMPRIEDHGFMNAADAGNGTLGTHSSASFNGAGIGPDMGLPSTTDISKFFGKFAMPQPCTTPSSSASAFGIPKVQTLNEAFSYSNEVLKVHNTESQEMAPSFQPPQYNFERPFADVENSADSGVGLGVNRRDSTGGFNFNFDDIVSYCHGVQSKRLFESQTPITSQPYLGGVLDVTLPHQMSQYEPSLTPRDESVKASVDEDTSGCPPALGSTQPYFTPVLGSLPVFNNKVGPNEDSAMDVDLSSRGFVASPARLWWPLDNTASQPASVISHVPDPMSPWQPTPDSHQTDQQSMLNSNRTFTRQQSTMPLSTNVQNQPVVPEIDFDMVKLVEYKGSKSLKRLKKKKHSKTSKKEKRDKNRTPSQDSRHEKRGHDCLSPIKLKISATDLSQKRKTPKRKKKARSPGYGAENFEIKTPARQNMAAETRTPKASVLPPTGETWKITPSRDSLKMTLCRVLVTPLEEKKQTKDKTELEILSSSKTKTTVKKHKKKRDRSPSLSHRRRKLAL